ncbi:hypothetical protein V1519DRAFT_457096 [Lipomyces tetrasporus]
MLRISVSRTLAFLLSHCQTAYRHRFYRGGEVLMSALAGLDIALWDIKGKTLGVSV